MTFKNNQHCGLTIEERFKQKYIAVSGTGCWEYQGWKDKDGYGRFWFNNKGISSHRFSYKWYIGEIPDGLLVCHKCDNPCCCNPFHLFLGTPKDNMGDALAKGRVRTTPHGTYIYYMVNKCKCQPCVEAIRAFWRMKAAEKRALDKQQKLLSLNMKTNQ